MAIIRYQKNHNDVDSWFDSMFNFPRTPLVDVKEGKDDYRISAEVPGFSADEIKVYVEKHVLHIEGEKSEKKEEKDGKKYLLKERTISSFSRSFTLPDSVDEEKIEASFKNGVLDLTLSKMPKEEPKKIEVKLN